MTHGPGSEAIYELLFIQQQLQQEIGELVQFMSTIGMKTPEEFRKALQSFMLAQCSGQSIATACQHGIDDISKALSLRENPRP